MVCQVYKLLYSFYPSVFLRLSSTLVISSSRLEERIPIIVPDKLIQISVPSSTWQPSHLGRSGRGIQIRGLAASVNCRQHIGPVFWGMRVSFDGEKTLGSEERGTVGGSSGNEINVSLSNTLNRFTCHWCTAPMPRFILCWIWHNLRRFAWFLYAL